MLLSGYLCPHNSVTELVKQGPLDWLGKVGGSHLKGWRVLSPLLIKSLIQNLLTSMYLVAAAVDSPFYNRVMHDILSRSRRTGSLL